MTSVRLTTESPSVIRTRLDTPLGDHDNYGCPDQTSRNILWRYAHSGTTVSRPCPDGTVGVAVRECGAGGRGWGVAHLGDCRSQWLGQIGDQYRAGLSVLSTTNSIIKNINRYKWSVI